MVLLCLSTKSSSNCYFPFQMMVIVTTCLSQHIATFIIWNTIVYAYMAVHNLLKHFLMWTVTSKPGFGKGVLQKMDSTHEKKLHSYHQ